MQNPKKQESSKELAKEVKGELEDSLFLMDEDVVKMVKFLEPLKLKDPEQLATVLVEHDFVNPVLTVVRAKQSLAPVLKNIWIDYAIDTKGDESDYVKLVKLYQDAFEASKKT